MAYQEDASFCWLHWNLEDCEGETKLAKGVSQVVVGGGGRGGHDIKAECQVGMGLVDVGLGLLQGKSKVAAADSKLLQGRFKTVVT